MTTTQPAAVLLNASTRCSDCRCQLSRYEVAHRVNGRTVCWNCGERYEYDALRLKWIRRDES